MENYIEILLAVLAVAILFAATLWMRWQKAKKFLKELAEALTSLSSAVEDDKFTREELDKLVTEFKDVIVAAGDLVGRK